MSLEEITKNHGTTIRIVEGSSTVGMNLKKEKEYGKGPFSEHESQPYWYMVGLNSYEEFEELLLNDMDIYSASFQDRKTGSGVVYVNGIVIIPKGYQFSDN